MAVGHYRDIRIKSFRGVLDLALEKCGPVNLLVGGNNSGKTSVLEALLLLTDPRDVAQWEAAVELRQAWPFMDIRFRAERLDRLDGLTWLFPRRNGEQLSIELEASGDGPLESIVASAERTTGVPPERPIISPTELIEAGYSVYPEDREAGPITMQGLTIEMIVRGTNQQPDLLSGASETFRMVLWDRGRGIRKRSASSRPLAFATPISHRSDGYLSSRFGRLIRAKRKEDAVALLQMLDSRIRDLVMVSPEAPDEDSVALPMRGRPATLHVDHMTAGLIPVYALGDGTRRAIHFATLLAEVGRDGILLIDEIEAGMHTAVLRDVFGWLGAACRTNRVQLFATTHSLEAVDAMLEAVPDNDVVLFRLKNGEARRYDGKLLRTARMELGQEVR
jgi:hypothetical protein